MAISKRLRFRVFERDGFQCQYCGERAPAVVLQVDHVNPRARGGVDSINNLTTSCVACNSGKSDTDLQGWSDQTDRPALPGEYLREVSTAAASLFEASRAPWQDRRMTDEEAYQFKWHLMELMHALLAYGDVAEDHPFYERIATYRRNTRGW